MIRPLSIFIVLLMIWGTLEKCTNNTDIKYQLKQPANIINYYSLCSEFTKRTCCSPKNIQVISKKAKKAVQSRDMSATCKQRIAKAMCSLCDGDWGEGYYDGICSSYCQSLYQDCAKDYFLVQSTTQKIRACQVEDMFCWKLEDLITHYIDDSSISKSSKFCELLDLPVPQQQSHDSSCWFGQISSTEKGKGKKTIDFKKTQTKRTKKKSSVFDWIFRKQCLYAAIVLALVLIVLYKFVVPKPKPQKYYSLR